MLGQLEVWTTYYSRRFEPGVASSGLDAWQCSPSGVGGPGLPSWYPPSSSQGDLEPPPGSAATYTGNGGTISYLAGVPFGDVGQPSFTLPVTDGSSVNQASWWGETEALAAEWFAYEEAEGVPLTFKSHHFSIEGAYTFEKVCDGTIAFNEGVAEGSCGGGGGSGSGPGSGGGAGPSSPPPSPPSPGPTPAPGLGKRKPHKCPKGFRKKRVHAKKHGHGKVVRCVKAGKRHHAGKRHPHR